MPDTDRAALALALEVLEAATTFTSMKARNNHARAVNGLRDALSQPAATPAQPAPSAEALPDFNDPRVQKVYALLCDSVLPPSPQQHWEGYTARRIVAALAEPKAQAQAAEPVSFLAPQDQADIERLNDLFLDDMPWDLEKDRMRHLAELGVIRHVSGGYYAITAFGRHCIDPEWGLPLRTIEQINADQARKAQERQA